MTKITKWTPKVCSQISNEIVASLKEIEEKYGEKIQSKGGRYGSTSYTLKLEVATLSSDGTALTQEANDFKAMASTYGLKPEYLDQEVMINGETVRIIGLKSRSHKYPILGEQRDGRTYKYPVDTIKVAFMRKGRSFPLTKEEKTV